MNFVVVGAGIPGIYASLRLKKKYPAHSVHLIESSNSIGGLYNSFQDPVGGTFDKGMHIVYETMNNEIDSLIDSALSPEDWIYLEGNRKDIAGVFYQGKLKSMTPYVDLNHLSRDVVVKSMGELMQTLAYPLRSPLEYSSSFDYFRDRFGQTIAEQVINPILHKLWKISSSDMHPASTQLVLMDRISLFNEETVRDLIKSSRLKQVIAYPNQLNLDLSNRTCQKGRYPKSYGLSNLITGFNRLLAESDVKIHLNSFVESIELSNSIVTTVSMNNKSGAASSLDDVKALVWCGSTYSLGSSLGLDLADKSLFDSPLIQKYVYILLDEKPSMKDMYYYYSLSPGTSTFRVTNYSSYCQDAVRRIPSLSLDPLYPLCIELHFANKDSAVSDTTVLDTAIMEMIAAGVISTRENIKFSRVISIPSGFPLLTNNNCSLLSSDRNKIQEQGISNLFLSGQIPEKGIFFLHETLSSLHDLLNSIK